MSTRRRPARPVRPRPVRRKRRGLPKPVGIAIVSMVGLLVLAALALVGFRATRSGSLPNVIVAHEDLGAMDEAELRAALRDIEAARRDDRITFHRTATGAAAPASTEATGEELGYEIDVDATVEEIMARGRQGNPVAALRDQLRATFGTIKVDPVDYASERARLGDIAAALSAEPFYGGVKFLSGKVTPRYPEPGVLVYVSELEEPILRAIRVPDEDVISVRGSSVEPATGESDVDALVETAELAVDGPVELTLGPRALTFTPAEIGRAIRTVPTGTGDDVELELEIPAKAMRDRLADLDSFETPPVDASFETSGDSVSIVPARVGFTFVPKVTARQLLKEALKGGPAEARLKGKKKPADFTTAEARELDIKEQVSTFTTYHSCCEPRVENIHRIADIVDGAIVKPGEDFSLNDYVGPRTTDNGFVGAPAIRDGEFVEEVGGGISQFATTMFNAIFFGGYDFLVYQPHSYYISRYPPGREATISSPAPDLAFLNDTDAGVLVETSYTEESITVSFYGNTDFDVDSVTGPMRNVKEPTETCRENASLDRGEEIVLQEGITGFDIVVTRTFSDGRPDETFTTHYDMLPTLVEKRRCPNRKRNGNG